MPKHFVENESYMHKAAKNVLRDWLSTGDGYDLRKLDPLSFRSNRKCGVWLEYPVAEVDGTNSIEWLWDEQDLSKGIHEYVPTYEECVRRGVYPVAVLDMAIVHKGTIMYGIEICHKHPTGKEKIEKITKLLKNTGFGFTLYEIDASWIMNQVERPKSLKMEVLWDSSWKDDDSTSEEDSDMPKCVQCGGRTGGFYEVEGKMKCDSCCTPIDIKRCMEERKKRFDKYIEHSNHVYKKEEELDEDSRSKDCPLCHGALEFDLEGVLTKCWSCNYVCIMCGGSGNMYLGEGDNQMGCPYCDEENEDA
jgi:hypothetical protein